MPLKIDEMFAFVAIDDNGDEGIIAVQGPNGMALPLVGADVERVDALRPLAEAVGRSEKKTIRLLHFTNRVNKGFVHVNVENEIGWKKKD